MVIIRMLLLRLVLNAQPTISVMVMVLLLVIKVPPISLIIAQLVMSAKQPLQFNTLIFCPLPLQTTICVLKVTGVTLATLLISKQLV